MVELTTASGHVRGHKPNSRGATEGCGKKEIKANILGIIVSTKKGIQSVQKEMYNAILLYHKSSNFNTKHTATLIHNNGECWTVKMLIV